GPVTTVSFYLNLAAGKYSGQTVSVPPGMTLYISGSPSSQLPTNFDPNQPAFTLVSGNVLVSNITFTSTGDAPTILVTGGNLTLRNAVVQESATSLTRPSPSPAAPWTLERRPAPATTSST